MKIIIAGSREFTNYKMLVTAINKVIIKQLSYGMSNDIIIISGNAKGADKLGEKFANENNYEISLHPANWDTYGKGAGYIRNSIMGKEGDVLVAFWDMESKGTRHMINLANEYNKKVYVVNYNIGKIKEDYKIKKE